MDLALECRTDLLELVQPFADFDFVLAHLALKDEEYSAYYRDTGKDKIVDNSVNENGVPVSLDELKEAFSLVNGTVVVSPDWIGDKEQTLEAYEDSVKEFGVNRVIGVIQGKDYKEAMSCLDSYKAGVAVPYDICSKKTDPPWIMGLRRALIVCNIPNDTAVHLLGFNCIEEFSYYKGKANILSIDTGVPVMLGLQEKDILDQLESKAKPTYNLMEELELTQSTWTGIIRNIALLRRYL